MTNIHESFMMEAINLAKENLHTMQGGPFGAVIVKDNKIIGRGKNRVIQLHDPTAHAEIQAIRVACQFLNTYHLNDSVIYTSCEPCPMCLSAIYWSRIQTVYYAATREDAAKIDFIDNMIYDELVKHRDARMITYIQLSNDKVVEVMQAWWNSENKKLY